MKNEKIQNITDLPKKESPLKKLNNKTWMALGVATAGVIVVLNRLHKREETDELENEFTISEIQSLADALNN